MHFTNERWENFVNCMKKMMLSPCLTNDFSHSQVSSRKWKGFTSELVEKWWKYL